MAVGTKLDRIVARGFGQFRHWDAGPAPAPFPNWGQDVPGTWHTIAWVQPPDSSNAVPGVDDNMGAQWRNKYANINAIIFDGSLLGAGQKHILTSIKIQCGLGFTNDSVSGALTEFRDPHPLARFRVVTSTQAVDHDTETGLDVTVDGYEFVAPSSRLQVHSGPPYGYVQYPGVAAYNLNYKPVGAWQAPRITGAQPGYPFTVQQTIGEPYETDYYRDTIEFEWVDPSYPIDVGTGVRLLVQGQLTTSNAGFEYDVDIRGWIESTV